MGGACVVFDIGGVLEYTPNTGWDGNWERRLGLPEGEILRRLEGVWRAGSVGTVDEQLAYAEISAALGLDAEQLAAFTDDLWAEYLGSANAELLAYAHELRARCALGILSNSFVGARQREETLYGFGALVGGPKRVVYSHEIGVSKPDPRAYRLTCERLEVRPADCLFVDDVTANVAAARAFGMEAVLFENNTRTIARVEEHVQRP